MIESFKTNTENFERTTSDCVRDRVEFKWRLGDIESDDFTLCQDESKFDIVLCFAILHHLRDPFTTLEKVRSCVNPFHLICISEIIGDNAPWANAFHKGAPNFPWHKKDLTDEESGRLRFNLLIRTCQQVCKKYGFSYNRESSAFDNTLYFNYLRQNGYMDRTDPISKDISAPASLDEWRKAIILGDKETSLFSTFPNKAHFESLSKSGYFGDSTTDDLIAEYDQAINEIFDSEIKASGDTVKELKKYHKITIMMREGGSVIPQNANTTLEQVAKKDNSHTNELIAPYANFPDWWMHLKTSGIDASQKSAKDSISLYLAQHAMSLINNGILNGPLFVAEYYWDIYIKKFQTDIPVTVYDNNACNSIVSSYFNLSDIIIKEPDKPSEQGDIVSFISQVFPVKVMFDTCVVKDKDKDEAWIDLVFCPTGEIQAVKFMIPSKVFSEIETKCCTFFKDTLLNLSIAKKLCKNSYQVHPFSKYKKGISDSASSQIKKAKVQDIADFVEEINKISSHLKEQFMNMVAHLSFIYPHNAEWQILRDDLGRDEHKEFFTSIIAAGLALHLYEYKNNDNVGMYHFYHLPSKDTWNEAFQKSPEIKHRVKELSVGGLIVLGTDSTIQDWALLNVLSQLKNKLFLIEEENHYKNLSLQKSMTAAIAAIMNRNGSHNIGSHVLSAVTSNYTDKDEDNRLFSYVQRRMEFIAQIASSTPLWTYGALFYRELWKGFTEQDNLLRFISQAEGLSYGFNEGSHKIQLNAWYQKNTEPLETIDSSLTSDFQVGIPGGIIGFHAFYTILGNIIRNSAKHSWVQSNANLENLEINVKVTDISENDYYKVEIWDNVSQVVIPEDAKSSDAQKEDESTENKPLDETEDAKSGITRKEDAQTPKTKPLDETLNRLFCKSFIDKFGSLKQGHWGLAEMKICAGFLAQRDIMDVAKITKYEVENVSDNPTTLFNEETGSGIIKAIPVKLKLGSKMENDKKTNILVGVDIEYLGYQFCIKKPKIALFVGFNVGEKDKEQYRDNGIYFEDCLSDKQRFNYEYLIINDKAENIPIECLDGQSATIENLTTNIYCYLHGKSVAKRNLKCEGILEIFEKLPLRTIIVSNRIKGVVSANLSDPIARRILVLDNNSPIVDSLSHYKANLKNKLKVEWMRHLKKDDLPNPLIVYLNTSGEEQDSSEKRKYLEAVYNRYAVPYIMYKTEFENESDIPKFSDITSDKLDAHSLATYASSMADEDLRKEILKTLQYLFIVHSDAFDMKSKRDKVSDNDVNNQETDSPDTVLDRDSDSDLNTTEPGCPDPIKITSSFSIKANNDEKTECHLYLNKHRVVLSDCSKNAWYKEALSGSQVTFHSLLDSSSISFLESLLNVVESSLYKILIVDERIASFFATKKSSNRLQGMGLYVADKIQFAEESFNVSDSKYVKDKGNECKKGITIHYLTSPRENQAVTDAPEIAIVHQSLLDKFRKDDLQNFLTWLKDNVKYVFLTSGRGDPRLEKGKINTAQRLYPKYIPYGNVEYCIKKEFPDKTLLARMLTNI